EQGNEADDRKERVQDGPHLAAVSAHDAGGVIRNLVRHDQVETSEIEDGEEQEDAGDGGPEHRLGSVAGAVVLIEGEADIQHRYQQIEDSQTELDGGCEIVRPMHRM